MKAVAGPFAQDHNTLDLYEQIQQQSSWLHCVELNLMWFDCLFQAVGAGVIGFGSYIVHIGQIEGSVFIVLAIGDIFIVAGIILVILIVVGIIGAALSSKIVLCQVTNNEIQCSPHNLNLQIHEK